MYGITVYRKPRWRRVGALEVGSLCQVLMCVSEKKHLCLPPSLPHTNQRPPPRFQSDGPDSAPPAGPPPPPPQQPSAVTPSSVTPVTPAGRHAERHGSGGSRHSSGGSGSGGSRARCSVSASSLGSVTSYDGPLSLSSQSSVDEVRCGMMAAGGGV